MATNTKEFLEQWSVESDPARREAMFREMTTRGLFPADIDYEKTYGLYPDIADENFLMKLFHKKEFAENKLESLQDLATCGGKVDFELIPVQRFISNYLSAKTPYNSALLYHGVGVGKTCSAISISEAYLYTYPKKKVFIIAPPNIQPNFWKTIFDIENVIIPDEIDLPNTQNGCTGNLYLELTGTQYEKDIHIIERKVKQLIHTRYEFMGYIQLATYIERIVGSVSPAIKDMERRRLEEIKLLRKEFSANCMIIDEAHNLRDIPGGDKEEDKIDVPGGEEELTDAAQGKRLTSILKRVLQYALDMKFVLLTATPMYNSYLEILFLLNLLLENDKMATFKPQDIFNSDESFKEGGDAKFGRIVQIYVSYMRGETPISFPIRLNPNNAPFLKSWPVLGPDNNPSNITENISERLLHLPIVPVRFGSETYSVFESILNNSIEKNKLNLHSIDTMIQSGNWIYPSDSEDFEDRIGDRGFDTCFSEEGRKNPAFTKVVTQYKSEVDARWLTADNLVNYSPKSAFILKRIRKSEGPIFIYSRFIKSGALALALALEANGYTPYGRDRGLLVDGVQVEGGLQCALCEHRKGNHAADHAFLPAKYVLLTGRKDISPNNPAAVHAERASSNYNGADIKVIIGSQIASEGIDFKFIREIYVFDSWYHLNKMEQVLGRGIRTCSHIHPKIVAEKRNCTVYLMVNTLEHRESADMYMYRKGMIKAIQIGKISRVIKRYAIDCNINMEGNLITDLEGRTQINSQRAPPQGTVVDINDKNYSNLCDWMECEYSCAEPINLDLDESMLTYDEYSSRWRESEIKKVIKRLFEKTPFIKIEDIQGLMTAVPKEALFSILHDIVNNKSYRLHVNGKEGYLLYRNGFYLFQPIELHEIDIPLALRIAHYPVKVDKYIPMQKVPVAKVEEVRYEGKESESEGESEGDGEGESEEGEGESEKGEKGKSEREKGEGEREKGEGEEKAKAKAKAPKSNFLISFWEIFVQVAEKLRAGTHDINSISLPSVVQTAINEKYKGNTELIKYNIFRIEMIYWLYISLKNNRESRIFYADVVLEYIWDNFLTSQEQILLLKKVPNKISEEQVVNNKYFRYINLQKPYDIKYISLENNKLIVESLQDRLEENDPYKSLKANTDTTGKGYGFIVPIDGVLTFKTNKDVARVGDLPEGGQGCKIISRLAPHIESLILLGNILKESGANDLELNREVLEGTSSRSFKNVQRYCAVRELVLRFMDLKKVNGLRWFYRPISSHKTEHGKLSIKSKTGKK